MNNLKEQRFAVKFCVKLGKSTTEAFAVLNTAYGDVAMKRARCSSTDKIKSQTQPILSIR